MPMIAEIDASRMDTASVIEAAMAVHRPNTPVSPPAAVKPGEGTSTGDLPQDDATVPIRWIPVIIPLLGALLACDTYVIGWVVLSRI